MNVRRIVSLVPFMSFLFIFLITVAYSEMNHYKVFLEQPFPLKLRYSVGETIYYRLIRHNINFKMDGCKFGELKAIAYFTRTRVENDNQGRVQEEFTWKSFEVGQSITPNQPIEMAYFNESEDFTSIISVGDENILSKFDFSRLPRTIEGLWFMIMAWDAVTFDGLTRPSKYFKFPEAALIGTEIKNTRGPHDFPFEYSPLVTDSKYSFSGKNDYSRVLGVGIVENVPCAIIEFSESENAILMNLHLEPIEMKSKSFEHFWGKTYLSLEDGRIVKGELVAPVAHIQDMQMPGQEEPQHLEYFFTLQKLDLEMLSAEEFELEVKKTREKHSVVKN